MRKGVREEEKQTRHFYIQFAISAATFTDSAGFSHLYILSLATSYSPLFLIKNIPLPPKLVHS